MEPTLRPSILADLESHLAQRSAMFKDMNMGDDAGRARMTEAFRGRLRTWLTTGQARGVIVERQGEIVAGALMLLKEVVPTPLSEQSVRGYVFNVYTQAGHRGQGHARRMTEALLDVARGLRIGIVELHASLDAEKLYKGMGFVPTSEMRLVLDGSLELPSQWKERR